MVPCADDTETGGVPSRLPKKTYRPQLPRLSAVADH
jgi:hypothetical protein